MNKVHYLSKTQGVFKMNIDGKNAVLGRLGTFVAKKLLAGEKVNIVNAEKVIITGNPKKLKEHYLARISRGSAHHGPYFPRKPNLIVRRAVRGMLPYKTHKGRAAFNCLRVYSGVPDVLKNEKFESVAVRDIKTNFITVGKIAKVIGWRE